MEPTAALRYCSSHKKNMPISLFTGERKHCDACCEKDRERREKVKKDPKKLKILKERGEKQSKERKQLTVCLACQKVMKYGSLRRHLLTVHKKK